MPLWSGENRWRSSPRDGACRADDTMPGVTPPNRRRLARPHRRRTPGEMYDWCVRPDCGAVVLFSGTVRDHADGRDDVQPPRVRGVRRDGRARSSRDRRRDARSLARVGPVVAGAPRRPARARRELGRRRGVGAPSARSVRRRPVRDRRAQGVGAGLEAGDLGRAGPTGARTPDSSTQPTCDPRRRRDVPSDLADDHRRGRSWSSSDRGWPSPDRRRANDGRRLVPPPDRRPVPEARRPVIDQVHDAAEDSDETGEDDS